MGRWMRRGLWTVAVLAILALAALAYVGQRIAVTLVTPALLREVTAGMQPPHPGDPQAALGLAFEDVTYDTPLGPGPAIWIPADASPGAPPLVAIFVHGIGGRPEDGYGFVPALNDAGVPVLMIAYRNDPGAPPAPDGLYGVGTTEWADLEAAVLHLRSLGHERVLLIGASMGGAVVGQFMMRSDESEGVVGLAFDSGVFDGGRSTAAITRRAGIPFAGLTTWPGTTIVGWRTGLDLAGGLRWPGLRDPGERRHGRASGQRRRVGGAAERPDNLRAHERRSPGGLGAGAPADARSLRRAPRPAARALTTAGQGKTPGLAPRGS